MKWKFIAHIILRISLKGKIIYFIIYLINRLSTEGNKVCHYCRINAIKKSRKWKPRITLKLEKIGIKGQTTGYNKLDSTAPNTTRVSPENEENVKYL